MQDDPQKVVSVYLKASRHTDSELLTFTLPFGIFEIVAVVPIPDENSTRVNGYCKLRIARNKDTSATSDNPNTHQENALFQQMCQVLGFTMRKPNTSQTRQDRDEVREDGID
jgi:hypothetical protein